MRTLLIEIHLDNKITSTDLELRHLLVDTIEGRDLGEVIEETSSPTLLEVVIETDLNNIELELQNLLMSLGFTDYDIKDITTDDN